MRFFVRYLLHPILLILNLYLWLIMGSNDITFLIALIFTHSVLFVFEKTHKAKVDWIQTKSERGTIYLVTFVDIILAGVITAFYEDLFIDIDVLNDLWVSSWNVLLQVFMLFFIGEFLLYWLHRVMHRFEFMWRASGHGFHHSFQNLHAINFLTAHPFELVFLILPTVFVGTIFGVSTEVVIGASILGMANASIVHSNIDMKPTFIGLILTSNRYHRLHHSTDFDESNTNYSCNVILFDRLFGTFQDSDTKQTGIGLTEPTLIEKILLPFEEPKNSTTSPKNNEN